MRVELICVACGSDEIVSDATATWDVATQAWVLAGVQDHETCQHCGQEGDGMALREPVTVYL